MIKKLHLPTIILATLIIAGCATINIPEGGEKDINPPVLIRSNPDSMAINFLSKELVYEFDEYFTVNNFQKQFLITPSFDKQLTYVVKGKKLVVKLPEYPRMNTTYQVYFGESIKDLNEGNTLKNFTRIFATGSFIDSSSLKGRINRNGQGAEKEENLKVFLYESLSDSTLRYHKPTYITFPENNGAFTFRHLKPGNYIVAALNDVNNNYLLDIGEQMALHFQPLQTDSATVELILHTNDERDSSFQLRRILQKDILSYVALMRPTLRKPTINLLLDPDSDNPTSPIYQTLNSTGDSLFFTLGSIPKADSFEIHLQSGDSTIRSVYHLKASSLDHQLKLSLPTTFNSPKDPIPLRISFPLDNSNLANLEIIDMIDSSEVVVDRIERRELTYWIYPSKDLREMGRYTLIPNIVQRDTTLNRIHYTSDTLRFNTSGSTNTGSLEFEVKNKTEQPLIVQLSKNNKIHQEYYVLSDTLIQSTYLDPGTYTIQAIIDRDKDKRYTSGSLFLKRPPERIIQLSKDLEVKNDWMIRDLTFTAE